MEKLYTSKTVKKMAGGGMHTPHCTPLAIRAHERGDRGANDPGAYAVLGVH